MSIVELDGDLVRELLPGALRLLEAANDVVQRGRNPKVLLFQTKLLTPFEVVVGVEHRTDGLSALLFGDGAFVVAIVELLEIKLASGSLAGPKSKIVGGGSIVTGNRNIVGDGFYYLAALPDGLGLAVVVDLLATVAVELDLRM